MNKKRITLYDVFIKFQLLAIILIIIDLLSKFICVKTLPDFVKTGEKVEVIKDFFYLKLVYNTGGAFSMLSDSTLFLSIVSLVAIIGIEYYLIKKKPTDKIMCIILLVLMAGAFGNFVERIFFQKVTDFLSFIIFGNEFATFNFADICITQSCIGLCIYIIFFAKEEHKTNNKDEKSLSIKEEETKND